MEPLELLKQLLAGCSYEIFSHAETIVSASDGVERGMGRLEETAPTFILETEKGPITAIISGRTRLSYKKIKKALGLKNVSLASPEVVTRVTGAEIGYVSLINPGLITIIDHQVTNNPLVYGGCGIPRHTLCINPHDLIRVTQAQVFDFTEPKDNG